VQFPVDSKIWTIRGPLRLRCPEVSYSTDVRVGPMFWALWALGPLVLGMGKIEPLQGMVGAKA
jgi:hypothetical protein